jgi:hypothetical protein
MPLWRDADSFTEADLRLLTRPTTAELCSFLQGLPHRDGFALACTQAKYSDWNHFYYAHRDSDSVHCRFSIRIGRHSRTTPNPNAYVTSFGLEHSHVLDALAFERGIIDQDTIPLLRSMSETGSTSEQLGMWLRKTKGICLSSQQVKNFVYGHDMDLSRTAETEELKECMRGIGGLCLCGRMTGTVSRSTRLSPIHEAGDPELGRLWRFGTTMSGMERNSIDRGLARLCSIQITCFSGISVRPDVPTGSGNS